MSFGDLLGSLTGNAASITNPTDATNAGIAVSVGDLIFGVIGEQTGLTSSGCTDNLGNTYTAQNVGTNDTTTTSGRAWYARVTVAGTLTAVHFAATASSNNVAVFAAVFKGPFVVTPIDANPANGKDLTSPFACPATGTLSQARELVVAWGVANGSTVWAATSPNTLVGQATTATVLHTVIGYQVVNATTTVTPNFTAASNPTTEVLGTASFKQQVITRLGGKGHDVGLVLHAPMNEGVGLTAHDVSGNLNHGTLTNSPTWVRSERFGNAIKTTSAAFSYVNFGDLQDANFVSTDSFSILLWYKGDTAQFTASQSTTTLTVSAIAAGTILGVGMAVETTAGASLANITALGTGTGGTGTYTVSTSATVASTNWLGAANGYTQFDSIAAKLLTTGNFPGWEIYLDYGSNPRGAGGFKIIDPAGNNALATTPVLPYISTGVYHLWAGVVDRTAQLCKLSFDGLPFMTASCSTVGTLQTTATVQVGFVNGQAGTYHDFRIYKRALSLAEINAIYTGQRYNPRTPFKTNASRWNIGSPTTALTTDFYMPSNNKLAMILDYDDPIIGHLTLNEDIASPVMSRFTLNADVNDPIMARNAVPSADIAAPLADRLTLNDDITAPAISRLTLNTDVNDPLMARNAVPSADINAPLADRVALNSDMNDPVMFRTTITPDIAAPLVDRLALSADVNDPIMARNAVPSADIDAPLMMRSTVPSADIDAPVISKLNLTADMDAPEASRAGLISDEFLPILTTLLFGALLSDQNLPLALALKLVADDIKPIATMIATSNDAPAPLMSKLTATADALQPIIDRLNLSADALDNLMSRINLVTDILAPLFADMGVFSDQKSPLASLLALSKPNTTPLGSSLNLVTDDTKPVSTNIGFKSGDVALPIVTTLLLLGLVTDRLFPMGSSLNLVADDINIVTANRGVINEYIEPFATKQAFVIDSPIPHRLPMISGLTVTVDRTLPDASLLAVTADRNTPLAAVLQLTFGVSADRFWPFSVHAALTSDQNSPLLSQLTLASSRRTPLLTRLGLAVVSDRNMPLFSHFGVISTRRSPISAHAALQKDEILRLGTSLKLSRDSVLPFSDTFKLNGTNFFYVATLGGIVALTSREQFPIITSLKLDTSFLPAWMMTTRSVWNAGYGYGDSVFSLGPFGFDGVPIFPLSFQNNVVVADQFLPLATSLRLARPWISPWTTKSSLSPHGLLRTSSALNLIKDEIEPLMTILGVQITSDQILPLLTRLIATTTADQYLPLADRLILASDTDTPTSSLLNLITDVKVPMLDRLGVQTDRKSPLSARQMVQTDRDAWLATQLLLSARGTPRLGTALNIVSDKTGQILSRQFRQNDQLIPLGASVLISNLASDERLPLMTSVKLVADVLDYLSAHLNATADRVMPTNTKLVASGDVVEPMLSREGIVTDQKGPTSTSLNLAGDIVTRMLIRNALLGVKTLPLADRALLASDPHNPISTKASLITDRKLPALSMVSLSVDAYLRIQTKLSLTADSTINLADALRLVRDEAMPVVPGISVTTQSGEAFFPIASRFALLADAASPLSSHLGLNGDEILRLMDRLDLVGDVDLPMQAVLGLVRDLGSGHTMLPMLLAEALVPGGTIIAEPKRTRILAMPFDPALAAEPKTTRVLRGGKRLV